MKFRLKWTGPGLAHVRSLRLLRGGSRALILGSDWDQSAAQAESWERKEATKDSRQELVPPRVSSGGRNVMRRLCEPGQSSSPLSRGSLLRMGGDLGTLGLNICCGHVYERNIATAHV